MPTELPPPLSPEAERIQQMPGCGLAAYTGLLVIVFLVGLAGVVGSTMQIMSGGDLGPRDVIPGEHVAVWQMKGMRQAGVAGLTEAPLTWHDESTFLDGSVACALFADRVARVDEAASWVLPYAAVDELHVQGDEYTGLTLTISGHPQSGHPVEFRCVFAAEEGGSRFHRQLESEVRQAHGLPPKLD
jgi:hypothetical protein